MPDHYRLYVSGTTAPFTFYLDDVATLNRFSGKPTMFAVEWVKPVDYGDAEPPATLILDCPTLSQGNTLTTWTGNTTGALCMLQDGGNGKYGETVDPPYLQRSALGGITQGDELNRLSSLHFRLLKVDGTEYTVPGPTEFAFSMVFWTEGVERPLVPYEFFHIWLYSGDRMSGTRDDFVVPVNMTSFSMHEHDAQWHVAASYVSNYSVPAIISCPDFASPYANTPVLGYWDGVPKRTIRGINEDSIGLELRTPIDRFSSLRIRLLEPATLGPLSDPELLPEWCLCLTMYKVK